MITKALKDQAIAAIEAGGVSPDGRLNVDSVTVFLKGSPAYDEPKDGLMPAGNFEYDGKEYAVYFR